MKTIDVILIVIGALWIIAAIIYIVYSKVKGRPSVGCGAYCNYDCASCDKNKNNRKKGGKNKKNHSDKKTD
ncbi:MAG: hypothetical protein SOV23_03555 [Eubacteriales bacterium]|nr:hypothetical protein [Christensenellaceae bacterium]MDY2751318.1 hypothetical protein [Eubacteriales bacterium]